MGGCTRARSFPFVASLDHLGPFARSARDLALAYDAMQGPDADDAGLRRPRRSSRRSPLLERGLDGLRIAVAGGYFSKGALPEALAAVERVAKALGAQATRSKFPKPRARAPPPMSSPPPKAPRCISTGCAQQARDFDPAVRDRLIAGAMVPATLVVKAQNFRRWYREQVLKLFETLDAILAPATPCTAPQDRPADLHARRRRDAGAGQYRHLHPADLLHRPAGGGGAGAARRRCRSACRSSPRPGARTSPCASRMRWNKWAWSRRRDPNL